MEALNVVSSKTDPYALLAELERRSRDCAEGLPAQDAVVELWNGIGFVLSGRKYVAPMGEVSEILHMPRYTQVPGVKGWLNGVANVRGRLLPIMDLAQFFGLQSTVRASRDKRVLVVERGDVFSGLIVDSVQGMQYFPVDSYERSVTNVPAGVIPFALGQYTKNDEAWAVFSPFLLIEDPSFVDVSQW
jgi:twitching motility protein PilI